MKLEQSRVEELFIVLDEVTEIIHQEMDIPYIESLPETLEILFTGKPDTEMSENTKVQVMKKIETLDIDSYEKEEIRKAIQLASLKGMKGATQQQHLVTPDTVALFMGYLTEKLIRNKKDVRLFDPAAGTGSLLTAVGNRIGNDVSLFGSEVDPTLIKIALMSANLQKNETELFHQDSLAPLPLEPADVVISDLPVGYYPDDIQANDYELRKEQGHSYSHHLLIEQSLRYAKEGAYLLFVIPNFLFESDGARKLNNFLKKNADIIGLIQLPESLFKSEESAKSIFIIRKKGKDLKVPKQALIVQLPSMKNVRAMDDILNQINQWFEKEQI